MASPRRSSTGKTVIDDGVEQRVGEVVGAGFADVAASAAHALADGIEDIAADVLLNGDEEMSAEEHADLLAADALAVVA